MKNEPSPSNPVDFVITWVDGSDPKWQQEKHAFSGELSGSEDGGDSRYRDYGLLRYWFRGVENYAPWVRKVHFVTCGHLPEWLNVSHPKLNVVRHSDYIPAEYLPTFSSHVIELNFHRIQGLSEQFVYFNDDMFLTKPVSTDLFFRDGTPVLCPELHSIIPYGYGGIMPHIYVNNTSALNRHFAYRSVVMSNKAKWLNPIKIGPKAVVKNIVSLQYRELSGVTHTHLPMPLLKSTMETVWKAEPELLESTCANRFRSAGDVSQFLFWQWQLMSGEFYPARFKSFGRRYDLTTIEVDDAIRKHRYPMVCINDNEDAEEREFEAACLRLAGAFEDALPMQSGYENNRQQSTEAS